MLAFKEKFTLATLDSEGFPLAPRIVGLDLTVCIEENNAFIAEHERLHALFDGEKGTYSDARCAQCPWADMPQEELDAAHARWKGGKS